MEMKFFMCERCGNIVAMVKESGAPLMCCGQKMVQLLPNTKDAAHEKHVPVITRDGDSVVVKVGSVDHPMLAEHYIEWIALQTNDGNQRKALKPGDAPKACFCVPEGDNIISAYAYCNLHGLWKA